MELNTDLTISTGNKDYRGDIMLSSQDLGIAVNREVVQFKTDLTISAYSDGTLKSEMKTDLGFSNNTMLFSVIDYAEVKKSILYFSKFFNVNFEEPYLWAMLASGTSEQINKSHLSDVYTAINNLAAKLNNFLEGTDSDNIINTWKELQDFLKGISGVQDLYTLIKSMVTYDNIMPLIKDHFIRKDQDDTTAHNISFANTADEGGNGITLGDKFVPNSYGGRLNAYYDSNGTLQTKLEIDYLKVRKKATFTELTIEELKSVGGSIILSPAAMKCSLVETVTILQEDIDKITQSNKYYDSETGEYKPYCAVGDIVFRCYFTDEDEDGTKIYNQFAAGDQARCQTFNVSEIKDYTGTADTTGSRYYWRLVVNIGENYIDLSQNDKDDLSDVPVVGDNIVQFGHRHDPTRQSAQVLSAYGTDSPSHIMYQGVGSTMQFPSSVEGDPVVVSGPYSLYGKEVYGLYYNVDSSTPQNSKMKQFTYGDWYVGTRDQDHRHPETTYLKFDTEKKQLTLRGVMIQSQYGDTQPIEFYRGVYTLVNPNCDEVEYYYMDSVTYTDESGNTSTYVHTGRSTTIGIRPTDASVWTPKATGTKGKDGQLNPFTAYYFGYSKYTTNSTATTPPEDMNEWTVDQHYGWYDIPPTYPLPQSQVGDTKYYLWMCVVYWTVNAKDNTYYIDTTNTPITYKRVEGETGPIGPDGTKGPYTDYKFAYSTDLGTKSSTTSPTIVGSWEDGVPNKPADASTVMYYLWMKIQKMKATEDNSGWIEDGDPTYARTEGENGEDGADAIIIDLDNEADYIMVGSDGILNIGEDSLTTIINACIYKGDDKMSLKDCKVSIPASLSNVSYTVEPTSGTPTSYKITLTIKDSGTTVLPETSKISITLIANNLANTIKTINYTLAFVRKGEDGEVYSILPSVKEIKYNTNDENPNFSDTSLTCKVYKKCGTKEAIEVTSGVTLKYYTDTSEAQTYVFGETILYPILTGFDTTHFSNKVKFELYYNDILVDYETVNIVKDGKDGEDTVTIDSDNDADYIMVGSDGILSVDAPDTQTTISMFKGTTQMTLTSCAPSIPEALKNIVTCDVTSTDRQYSEDKKECTLTFHIKKSSTVLKESYKIPITAVAEGQVVKVFKYTLAFVHSGTDGESYVLLPSCNEIKWYSNAKTPYFSEETLTCQVYKKQGTNEYIPITKGDTAITVWYYVDNKTTGYPYEFGSVLAASRDTSDASHFQEKVSFILKYKSTIIDSEDVHIIEDGINGTSGNDSIELYLSDNVISMAYDSENHLLSDPKNTTAVLQKGGENITSGVVYKIFAYSGVTSTDVFITDSSTGKITINSISNDGFVTITATYNNKEYSKNLQLNRTISNVDYYLEVSPSSISYNITTGVYSTNKVGVIVRRKGLQKSGKVTLETLQTLTSESPGITLYSNTTDVTEFYSGGIYEQTITDFSKSEYTYKLLLDGEAYTSKSVTINTTKDGTGGDNGDSTVIMYTNSPVLPATPTASTEYPPDGWRMTTAVSGSYTADVDTSILMSGKYTKDFDLDRETINNVLYHKIQGFTNEHNTLQCVKVVFKSASLSSYNILITLRSNTESYDKIYVGLLDSAPSTSSYSVSVSGTSGTGSCTLSIPDANSHFVYIYYVKDSSQTSGTDAVYFNITCPTDANFVEEGVVYSCTGTKSGKTGIVTWNQPQISEAGNIPMYSYCGDWNSYTLYKGNYEIINLVSVPTYNEDGTLADRSYYRAVYGIGNIPLGVHPTKGRNISVLTIKHAISTSVSRTISASRCIEGDTIEAGIWYYGWGTSQVTIARRSDGTSVHEAPYYTDTVFPTTSSSIYTKVGGVMTVSSSYKIAVYTENYIPGEGYWKLISKYSSIATDLLLAENAILNNAVVRSLLTEDSPKARINIEGNDVQVFDANNSETLHITGDEILDAGTPTSYSINTSTLIECGLSKQTASIEREVSISTFIVQADGSSVTIPTITFKVYTFSRYSSSSQTVSVSGTIAIKLINASGDIINSNSKTLTTSGTVTLTGSTDNYSAGTYSIVIVASISAWSTASTTLYSTTYADGNIFVSASSSTNKISLGSNGLVINAGNDFAAQMLKSNGSSKIVFLGKNSSGTLVGLRITSAGVEYTQTGDTGWTLLNNSGGGSGSSGGTVTSIGMSVPTGFSVSPTKITTSGTFTISMNSNYQIPTKTQIEKWDAGSSGRSGTVTSVQLASNITGLSVSGTNPITSSGTLYLNALSGYSLLNSDDAQTWDETVEHIARMAPELRIVTSNNSAIGKRLLVKHPYAGKTGYSIVLMVYSPKNRVVARQTVLRIKKGWCEARGDTKDTLITTADYFDLTNTLPTYIIRHYARKTGYTDTAIKSMTYAQWKALSFTAANNEGFDGDRTITASLHYKRYKKFGIALRWNNPDFSYSSYHSNPDGSTGLSDGVGMINGQPRYFYSKVAPLDVYMQGGELTFGVAGE